MENQHHLTNRDKLDQDQQQSTSPQPPSSSSPAHEFSFTISLHHHQVQPLSSAAKLRQPSVAVDLSPADEIFFHGHLLPLHLLSHFPHPSSPRSSSDSPGNFTLPINEDPPIPPINERNPPKQKPRSKSFSLFGIPIRRKADRETEEEEREKQRKKLKLFDFSHVMKRYMRMVRPLFNRRRESDMQFRKQPYSFSGYLSPGDYIEEEEEEKGRRRREFSAPASMKTSPYNSGPLLGNGAVATSDSTMEELQAAIQAAIAHCKNSISMEDKINGC